MVIVNIIINVLLVAIGIFSILSLGSLLATVVKVRSFDELEFKAVFDSLGYSMLIILGLHFIQLVIGIIWGYHYQLFVSSGFINRSLITNAPLRIEAFLFDCFVISVIYTIIRYRYQLIPRSYLVKNILFPLLLILGIAAIVLVIFFLR